MTHNSFQFLLIEYHIHLLLRVVLLKTLVWFRHLYFHLQLRILIRYRFQQDYQLTRSRFLLLLIQFLMILTHIFWYFTLFALLIGRWCILMSFLGRLHLGTWVVQVLGMRVQVAGSVCFWYSFFFWWSFSTKNQVLVIIENIIQFEAQIGFQSWLCSRILRVSCLRRHWC